jgi:hypothetical protein
MICSTYDTYVKGLVRNLEMLWCAHLNDGTTVYSDYERPGLETPWVRLREHCKQNDLFITKIEVIMFGSPKVVVFENQQGLDGVFIVRGMSRDLNIGSDEPGPSYKQLVVGLLRENEDTIDVKKFCWPENEFEKFIQTRSLTPDNAKLMIFKNDSTKKKRQSVQIALNGASV